jgi:TonB-linked SusC/RagA family outer membrane protein
MRKIFLFILFVTGYLCGHTQTISGTIFDKNGIPLSGVTIKEKSSPAITLSDGGGTYKINVTNPKPVLLFTSTGYKSQEVLVSNQTTINVVLEPEFSSMDEVVVVGYGTQKKGNLSGAVVNIDEKALKDRPVANIAQGLQGVAPNLNIQFNSGGPGEAANINIRGITSINGGGPLILVDDVPTSPAELNRISVQDVANISVIKDASAAAIYGARASFGVLLITTKEGTQNKTTINYSNNLSINKQTVIPNKITDPYIFSKLLQTSTDNTPWNNVNYNDQFYKYAKERSDDPSIPGVRVDLTNPEMWEYMGDKDWTRYIMKDGFFTQNHDLSISGRSNDKKANYYLSAGYNNQKSPLAIAKDEFNRFGVRSKINYKINDWLKVGNNLFISNTTRDKPLDFSLFDTYNIFPTDYNINPDGTWANTDLGRLAADIVDGGRVTDKIVNVQSTFSGEVNFFNKLLKINTDYTFQRSAENYNSYSTRYRIGYGPNDVREEGDSYAYRYGGFGYYNLFNIYATIGKKFNKHDVNAVLGYSAEDYRFEDFEGRKNNLISSSFPTLGLATGEATTGANISSYAITGAFYRLNYIYDKKYIIEFNGRYDGSSRFPSNNRFGFFPSASVAWKLDRENFLANVKQINDLKLRFSYGSLGNQSVSNYGYIPTMSMFQAGYLVDGARPNGISAPGMVSDNYTWERVNTTNYGLDFALFNNQITGSIDVYRRNTLNMLTLGKKLPGVLGASEPKENAADLQTKGWELSLGYHNEFMMKGSPLSVNVNLMLSDSKTWITKFDNPNKSILQFYEGMELGEIWGLTNNGLFKDEAEIKALDETALIPWGALQIVPGWPKYVDKDGNGKIEKGYVIGDTKDLSIIGNSNPRYRYGADINLAWKGFDLRLFFQGVGKRDYYPLDYLYWGHFQQPYGGTYYHLLDFYRPTASSAVDMEKHSKSYIAAGLADQNLNAKYPILQSWLADRNLGARIDQSQGLAIPQTAYMLDGSYLRLKNLTVGYTLPNQLTSRFHIASLRIFFSGENITEWSKLKKYFDPEAVNTNIYNDPAYSPSRSGNGMTYPFQRTYSTGINITF